MFDTLAYYVTVFHRAFTAYTSRRLQQLGLNFGSLFLVIYVGKHPDCTQAELTDALRLDWGYSSAVSPSWSEMGSLCGKKSGRAYHLRLSERGQDAFRVSHQVFFDWIGRRSVPSPTPSGSSSFPSCPKFRQKRRILNVRID